MIQFDTGDLGKLVEIELDPQKNKIGLALGASAVSVYGKILEIKADYVVLETITNIGWRTSRRRKEISYDLIKSYKFT